MLSIDAARLERAYQTALAALLAERHPEGYWVGELSTSALSTATAVAALSLVQKQTQPAERFAKLISGGLAWLQAHQNPDGGWGDTVKSFSNISTTMLCRAAFHLAGTPQARGTLPAGLEEGGFGDCLTRAENWLVERYGRTAEQQAEAVRARYGKDRTFAVPILTTCALAGLVSWQEVPSLPFELACLPQSWFRFLKLQVVSYALPALIAIGQAVYHHRPPWNPLIRLVRRLARGRSLKVLRAIQPSSGGYLEATPLTSFVTLSLASIGLAEHPVAQSAVEFLVKSVRADGSWPIDSNLATWVTTLAINALATAGELEHLEKKSDVVSWLLKQQSKEAHPYTGARPGAWGWTDLPGSVPDADDTPGAIIALRHLNPQSDPEPMAGIRWLEGLQNRDGGWPTFCRGWGHLPFDRSGADLTAHALRAFALAFWVQNVFGEWVKYILTGEPLAINWEPSPDGNRAAQFYSQLGRLSFIRAFRAGFRYLSRVQRPDGSWLPLWFGNQHAPDDENPTYGTARVLAAYRDLDLMHSEPARRGVDWLLSVQNGDGGWGGAKDVPSSVEETALAVEVLLDLASGGRKPPDGPEAAGGSSGGLRPPLASLAVSDAVNRGLAWLVQQVELGGLMEPTPIGFYFAKLWYFEKLYPIIFTVAALGRARQKLAV